MKILHVYAQKPDHTGSGVYIQNLIKNLHSQGISNYLICATSVFDDIEKDFLPHFSTFYNSEEKRTCKKCGTVMETNPKFTTKK